MDGDYQYEGSYNNINESIRIAKQMRVYDVINATGKHIAMIAEIISRLKVSDELELMEIELQERAEA